MKKRPFKPSFRQVQYFVEVAKAGSLNGASRVLNVSQPAIGVQINHLEALLGCPLLRRHPRGIELTQAGETFLRHAQDALDALQRGADTLAAANRRSIEILFGVTPSAGRAIVEDMVDGRLMKDATYKLLVRQAVSDELFKLVSARELHAGTCFDPEPSKELMTVPLYREDLVLVGPPGLVRGGPDPLSQTELQGIRLALGYDGHGTRRLIDALCHQRGVKLDIALEIEPLSLTGAMMKRHKLCTIIPYSFYLHELVTGNLASRAIFPAMTRTLTLIMNDGLAPAARKWLVTVLHQSIRRKIKQGHLGWRLP